MDQNPGNSQGGSGVSDTAGLVAEQVQSQAQQVAQQAQQTAGQVATQAKQQTTSALNSQKDKAADSLESVAQALRQTSQQLQQQQGGISQLVNKAADRVEQVSQYLRNRDVNDLVYDAEGYARSNPGVFLGGALALGFLTARFLKSSPPSSGNSRYTSGGAYGGGYSGGTYGGGNRSGGMPEGQFDYANVQHRYEDVRGIPPVDRGYATGMMSTSVAPETMTDDMGTGLMADHPDSGDNYGS
jgi:ElaB/YqjD/DUF883 family membrane-anchored ribosome-binding protein